MRSLQLHGHSWQTPLVCVVAVVSLSGCIVDARDPYARFVNHLDAPVTVQITGIDETGSGQTVELGAGEDYFLGEEEGCLGDGLVVTSADGVELAVYEGAICTDTDVNVWDDGTGLTVTNSDGKFSVPLATLSPAPAPSG